MRSRRTAAVAAWALAAVLVAGCSDDEPDRPEDPRPSGSTTTPATDGSESPSDDASASDVEPATGQQVTMESGISFRLTEGPDWLVDGDGTFGVVADAEVDEVPESILLDASEVEALTDDVEVAANASLDGVLKTDHPNLRRVEDREVNGVTGYVLRAEDDEAGYYLFGVLHEGTSFTLSLEVPLELELEDWVEPILASIEWS